MSKKNTLVFINIIIIMLSFILIVILLKKNIKNEKFTDLSYDKHKDRVILLKKNIKNEKFTDLSYDKHKDRVCVPHDIKYTNIGTFSKDYSSENLLLVDAEKECNNNSLCKGFTLIFNKLSNTYTYLLKKDIVSHKVEPSKFTSKNFTCFMKKLK